MRLNDSPKIPHLQATTVASLQQLEKTLLQHQVQIEAWLREQWHKTPPPVYASVDLRNAGFKLAPVDTNLFSAGFNNLNPEFMPLYIQAAQVALDHFFPGCTRILLIPESHTRNPFYFESLAVLQEILLKAGFAVRIGTLHKDVQTPQTMHLPSGRQLQLEPLERKDNRLSVAGFSACMILLNNDLSEGVPEILQGLTQPVSPPLMLGWATRRKSVHFGHYAQVSEEFAEVITIDPWLIAPLFRRCGEVNFLKREGEECLVHHTEQLLNEIQRKYAEYGITHKPFVVIKADSGTYGMGVMTVHSAEEIRHLNRKKRTNMSTAKGNRTISEVILQEGVYTFETWQEAVAEPVVYMIGNHVVGGFYRVHTERGVTENLNAPGMQFVPLAFMAACNNPEHSAETNSCANRFYNYGVIARLALVAAAREQHAVKEKNL